MANNLDDESTRVFEEEAEAFLKFSGGVSLTQNDIFLAIMGATGSGKSSFVARCTNTNVKIGHDLLSCTSNVSIRSFDYASRRIHLIDTPGWDDTYRSDIDTLTTIAQCLCTSYANGIKLSGIIYLQRISDNRMGGSAKRNFDMFKALCGESTFPSIFLVTTMWNSSGNSQVDGDVQLKQRQEQQREQELASSFWADVVRSGGTMMKHTTDSRESALRILDEVLNTGWKRQKSVVLAIQKEMVDYQLPLVDTAAGRQVNKDLTALRDQLQVELNQTRKEIREAQERYDEETERHLKGIERDFHSKLQSAEAENQELRLSLEDVYRKMEARVATALEQMNEEAKAAIKDKEDELEAMRSSALYITEEIQRAQRAAEKRADMEESARKQTEMQDMKAEYEEMLRDMKAEIAALRRNREKKEKTGNEVLSSLASGTASGLGSGIATSLLTAAAGGAALAFCTVS